ncbi:MAG: S41 family peptidase [Butyrivibrio hungatei]|nr:S41 family peptidase [Butyrivibrio hungatei]
MKRLPRWFKLAVVIIVFVIISVYSIYQLLINPYRETTNEYVTTLPLETELTQKQILGDIDYVIGKLRERHPAWLEKENKRVDAVEAKYSDMRKMINDDEKNSYTVLEEWQILSRIMNQLYDGHSRVDFFSDSEKYIDDFSQINEYGNPITINGEPTEKILESFLNLFQYERVEFAQAVFGEYIKQELYLNWLGVDTSDGVTFKYVTDSGEKEYHYSFVPYENVANNDVEESEWVNYEIEEKDNLAIFTLKECDYNDLYVNTVNDFFDKVDSADIENVIVDLRGNGGGNSYVANEFLSHLNIDGYMGLSGDVRYGNFLIHNEPYYYTVEKKENAYDGKVFILTDVFTFSSAMDFAMFFKDNNLGTVVGEASDNMPESYGDVLSFTVPNSKLAFSVSYKKWHRIDQSKCDEPIKPDYECKSQDALSYAKQLIVEKKYE